MARTSRGARNFDSSPGTIHNTPLGLACADETFAISRDEPMPIEQFNCVSSFIRWCSLCAARSGGPCSRNHAALVALSAYNYGFTLQRGIVQLFYRDEEGIHVDVEDGAGRHKDG